MRNWVRYELQREWWEERQLIKVFSKTQFIECSSGQKLISSLLCESYCFCEMGRVYSFYKIWDVNYRLQRYYFTSILDPCQQAKFISASALLCPLFLLWKFSVFCTSYSEFKAQPHPSHGWSWLNHPRPQISPPLNPWCPNCHPHPTPTPTHFSTHQIGIGEPLDFWEQGSGLNCFAHHRYSLDHCCVDWYPNLILLSEGFSCARALNQQIWRQA